MSKNTGKKENIPVKQGDKITINIEGMNHQGEGIGRYEGFTVFVPEALPGEKVSCKIISIKKNYCRALILEIFERSPDRVSPPCPYYGECGGCQLQHLSYVGQLKFKEKQLIENLAKLGKLSREQFEFLPIIGMKNPWNYRNKIQLPVRKVGENTELGFFKKRSHELIPVKNCMIQDERGNLVLMKVRELLYRYDILPYDEKRKNGLLRHVVIRIGVHSGEIIVIFVTRKNEFPNRKQIVAELKDNIPGLVGVVHNINQEATNVILGEKYKTIWGRGYLKDKLKKLEFKISPAAFYQVNSHQSEKLYEISVGLAGIDVNREKNKSTCEDDGLIVVDAYSGIGTISLFFALYGKNYLERVVGMEMLPDAVEDAKENAKMNGLEDKTKFWQGKVEEIFTNFKEKTAKNPDILVIDPPRKGCDKKFLQAILHINPKKIIYISCNPATLARDLDIILYTEKVDSRKNSYEVKTVQAVDMFPHTVHVECVVLISRVDK